MNLHIVGGFLGSGKTTAIIQALKILVTGKHRVGVITNDKGRYLVDTAFFGTADIPAAQVSGGCFRCNFDDFQERIAHLQKEAHPEVLFAESVGSCVDLVGPVLTPLTAISETDGGHVTYSVFADIRLLHRHISGKSLPFSDNINYIFEKQLEEANLLIINKSDLMPENGDAILDSAQCQYPEKKILLQSSLTQKGVAPWLDVIQNTQALPPAPILEINYTPYIAGAAEMAWFNEQLTLTPPEGLERETIIRLISEIHNSLCLSIYPVAHLKFFIQDTTTGIKLSMTSLDEGNWHIEIPQRLYTPVKLLINARVQMPAARLETLITQILHSVLLDEGVQYSITGLNAFEPQVPDKKSKKCL